MNRKYLLRGIGIGIIIGAIIMYAAVCTMGYTKKDNKSEKTTEAKAEVTTEATTEATTENKFQICLSKLNSFQTKEIALNDIQILIASNKTNHKALRHFISALKIQNKSSSISNSSKEAQAKIYGIIAKEYKDNLYDPIDKPPNLLKSIERLLTQLREGYLQSNEQIQRYIMEKP